MRGIQQSLVVLTLAAANAIGGAAAHPMPSDSSSASGDGVRPLTTKATHGNGEDHNALTLTIYQNGLGLVHARAIPTPG